MSTEILPKDTERELYVVRSTDLAALLERIEQKWPGITPAEITIEAEHTHIRPTYHDHYDAGDYRDMLCITASDEYFARTRKPAE